MGLINYNSIIRTNIEANIQFYRVVRVIPKNTMFKLIKINKIHTKINDSELKVSKVAKIRNRYNQVPHLTQDTNGKVTNSQKTPQTRAKRSALSQQVTTKHI